MNEEKPPSNKSVQSATGFKPKADAAARNAGRRGEANSDRKPRSTFVKRTVVPDNVIDAVEAKVSKDSHKNTKGMATVESTLNSMTGDISYDELLKIPGVSTMAVMAKANVGEVSIFQKKDYTSSLKNCKIRDIVYHNIPLLKKFVASNGRMVPRRISMVSGVEQKYLSISIKHARFLGLLSYVDY